MTTLRRPPALVLAAIAVAGLAAPVRGQAVKPIESFWVTDNDVYAVTEAAGTVYLGGTFKLVGPRVGHTARLSAATGDPELGLPYVDGRVAVVAPDGAGGWYLGGTFATVGGVPRSNLAHILADGRVSAWDPAPSAGVYALAISGPIVYAGGSFATIGGQARNRIAALDATTGLATPWNPDANGLVRTIAVDGNTVYFGGDFTLVGGLTHNHAAAVDATTAALTSWNPNADSYVFALRVSGSSIYAAGYFTNIGGQNRSRIARLDKATGAADGWNPNASNDIFDIAVSGSTVYAGGAFLTIGGQSRAYLAALDTTSGLALSWNPSPNTWVYRIAVSGNTVYVAGFFITLGGITPRYRLAAVDATTGLLTAWTSHANFDAYAIAAWGPYVYAGGDFIMAGGRERSTLAAIDVASGQATSLAPMISGGVPSVLTLAASGGTLYAGGNFNLVSGQTRNSAAAFDAGTGALKLWNPSFNNTVSTLAVPGSSVFAGGLFTTVGILPRNRIAEVDTLTGTPTLWDPGADNTVQTLAASGGALYVGGDFLNAAGQGRTRLAKFDTVTGSLDGTWNPGAGGTVEVLVPSGSVVYAGGAFTTIGGQSLSRLARLDATTGVADAVWNPNASSTVKAIAPSGSVVFAGGDFTTLGGQPRSRIGSVQAGTGAPTPWDPGASLAVEALAVAGGRLYAGGRFGTIAGEQRRGFAAFCLAAAPTALNANPGGNNEVNLSWTGTGAGGYGVYRSRTSGGPYQLLGTTPSTSFTDATAEGGVPYFYVVRAVDGCESDPSNEAPTTPAGACALPADFEGVIWGQQASGTTCAVQLGWSPGNAPCGGAVHYSVYRDTSPSFTPDVSNRIATSLASAGYGDTSALVPSTTYFYVVRATSLVNGEEDGNLIRFPVTPAACTATAPPPLAFFTVRSGDGANTLEWLNPPAPFVQTRVCWKPTGYPTNESDGTCFDEPGLPNDHVVLPDPAPNDVTRFYAAWADATGSGLYSSAKTSFGRPTSTAGAFRWSYATGATTLAPAGVIRGLAYVSVSNDRVVHSMAGTPSGGTWPGGWKPVALNGPAQNMPTVVQLPITRVMGADTIALVGSQDGRVHAFDALTGAPLWTSPVLGTAVQATPSAIFTDFGGDYDLVLVGSRTPTGDSKLYALHLGSGTIAWSFDNGGGANGIGIISGQAQVEYSSPPRVYFTSRRRGGGSSDTVWCLSFSDTARTKIWSQDYGDVDSGPILRNGRVLVGNNAGEVRALDPANGDELWTSPYSTGDGPIKGAVWVSGPRLFFSTNGKVHGITDNGPGMAPTPFWTGGAAAGGAVTIGSPSPPLLRNGRIYVGGDMSRVYSIDATTPTPASPTSVVLGDPLVPKVAGTPTSDNLSGLVLVGTDQGAIYALAVPF
jgi:outer membrane protein assembly factor BamB